MFRTRACQVRVLAGDRDQAGPGPDPVGLDLIVDLARRLGSRLILPEGPQGAFPYVAAGQRLPTEALRDPGGKRVVLPERHVAPSVVPPAAGT